MGFKFAPGCGCCGCANDGPSCYWNPSFVLSGYSTNQYDVTISGIGGTQAGNNCSDLNGTYRVSYQSAGVSFPASATCAAQNPNRFWYLGSVSKGGYWGNVFCEVRFHPCDIWTDVLLASPVTSPFYSIGWRQCGPQAVAVAPSSCVNGVTSCCDSPPFYFENLSGCSGFATSTVSIVKV